jgi:hypothetical protein
MDVESTLTCPRFYGIILICKPLRKGLNADDRDPDGEKGRGGN